MKICAISDLHGYLPTLDQCNLVLICGDSVDLSQQVYYKSCYNWYIKEFKPWANSLPCDKVLFIAGNHELGLQGHDDEWYDAFPTDDKVTFLFDDEYIYDHLGTQYRIYGTPWCKQFGNWAYMANSEQLTDLYSQIPEGLDILMTHDQPYKYGDILTQDVPWNDGTHIGNVQLLEAIEKKQPVLHICGHLHSCPKEAIKINNTTHYNVSIKDEKYEPVYEPLYLDITWND